MIRFYPDEEGYKDKNGNDYPLLAYGTTAPALDRLIEAIKDRCHKLSWGLAIHSANDGTHESVSMHYRGLAIDFDCYKLNPVTGRNLRQWCSFAEQQSLIEEIAKDFPDDLWMWPDDLGTHSHVSVHP
jgi:hypothetical protein